MPDFEDNGFQGMWLPGRRVSGEHGMVLVAKRRFDIDPASAVCVEADETPPVALAAEFFDPDNPASSSVAQPGELALEKPRVDVLVQATAYAPGGEPATDFEVGLRIAGVVERRLRIIGPRVARWRPPQKWVTDKEREKGEQQEFPPPEFSPPLPITELPLRYEHAFGGVAKIVLEDHIKELAAAAREEADQKGKARERKKEIEAELAAEDEKMKQAAAEEAAQTDGPTDEVARQKADEAFAAGGEGADDGTGTRVVDADTLARLAEEDEGDAMVAASPYRLGKDLPDRPDGRPAPELEVPEEDGGAGDEVASATDGMFAEGTSVLDLAALGSTDDELAEALRARHVEARGSLRDSDGTLRVRTEGMRDVALSDDRWIGDASASPETTKAEPEPEDAEEHPTIPYAGNPAGRGYCVSPLEAAVHGLKLPCIEYLDRPLRPADLVQDVTKLDLGAIGPAAGFASYPMGWFPRARLAGCMPWDLPEAEAAMQKALEDYDPDDPDDQLAIETIQNMEIPVMQPGWFNEAHPHLQVERIDGDEDVYVDNLTPEGHLFFRLPGRHPRATLDLGKGPASVRMRLDTLTIDLRDPARPGVELLWRGWYPMHGFKELEEATRLDVRLLDMDQDAWADARREELRAASRPEGTRAIQAIDDEDEAFDLSGDEADRRHRADLAARREAEGLGAPRDTSGAVVEDGRDDHKLADDEWDDEIRADKERWEEEALERQRTSQEARDKEIRKKAREQADEEFGIERGDGEEEGE